MGVDNVNANPVILDAAGRAPTIFLDGTYKLVIENSDGVQLRDGVRDPVNAGVTGGSFGIWVDTTSYSIPNLVTSSDGARYQSIQNNNLNNDPANDGNPTFWERIILMRIWNTNATYDDTENVIASDGQIYVSQLDSNIGNDPTSDNGTNWLLTSLSPVIRAASLTFASRNF